MFSRDRMPSNVRSAQPSLAAAPPRPAAPAEKTQAFGGAPHDSAYPAGHALRIHRLRLFATLNLKPKTLNLHLLSPPRLTFGTSGVTFPMVLYEQTPRPPFAAAQPLQSWEFEDWPGMLNMY